MRSVQPRRIQQAATAVALGAAMLGVAAAPASAMSASSSTRHAPHYYLALGDSLAAGYQTLPGGGFEVGHGYAQDIAGTLKDRADKAHHPFSFTDLGCPGETTGSMIGGGCPFPTPYAGAQLDVAVAYLKAHQQDSVVVTLDIGANNVDRCAAGGNLDPACAANGIATVAKDLGTILTRLKTAAGPHTRIIGMNLYDPFLAAWVTGAQGKVLAGLSVPLADALNATIDGVDAAHHVPTADVAAKFNTNSMLPLVWWNGQQVPLNVARVLTWTNMTRGDIHANDTGYEEIADTFLHKI